MRHWAGMRPHRWYPRQRLRERLPGIDPRLVDCRRQLCVCGYMAYFTAIASVERWIIPICLPMRDMAFWGKYPFGRAFLDGKSIHL